MGNYIGALKQWIELQHRFPCLFCIVDLHAITVPQDPADLRRSILEVAATYLAIGVNPERSTIYVQSEVPEHAELAWMLSTIAKMGQMERMTQYKDKSEKYGDKVGLGLFSYPVLMAADILLYDTTIVPVGDDQSQHVELTRDLAERFNKHFGPTFTLPQLYIQKQGARIMSLQDATKKMSKSDASGLSKILLTDDADTIRKKIMKAVTDTEPGVKFDPVNKPAVANLMTIYHHMTGQTMEAIEESFAGKGYGDFKTALADVVIAHMEPISKKIHSYLADPAELTRLLNTGRNKARGLAEQKIKLVRDRMGLGRAY
jgi:tryptophanyl-tRNA synthetase